MRIGVGCWETSGTMPQEMQEMTMRKVPKLPDEVEKLPFKTARCYIGHSSAGGCWHWREVNKVEYRSSYLHYMELEAFGIAYLEGPPDNVLITQFTTPYKEEICYRGRIFLKDPRVEVDPWDQDLLAAVA